MTNLLFSLNQSLDLLFEWRSLTHLLSSGPLTRIFTSLHQWDFLLTPPPPSSTLVANLLSSHLHLWKNTQWYTREGVLENPSISNWSPKTEKLALMGRTGKAHAVTSLTLPSNVNGLVQRGASSILILHFEKLIPWEPWIWLPFYLRHRLNMRRLQYRWAFHHRIYLEQQGFVMKAQYIPYLHVYQPHF
jgi:hypothetical protein